MIQVHIDSEESIILEKKYSLDIYYNKEAAQSLINYLKKDKCESINTPRFEYIADSLSSLSNIINQLASNGTAWKTSDFFIPKEMMIFANDMLKRLIKFDKYVKYSFLMNGIKKAQGKGIKFGRKNKLLEEQVADLKARKAKGVFIKDLMEEFKLSKASIYRYLKL